MIRFSTILFFFLISAKVSGQEIIGKVMDAKSKTALEYVNIGIVNKDVGTISIGEGKYTFDIDKISIDEQLTFSIIGYVPKSLTLPELKSSNYIVELEPTIYQLEEAIITASANVSTTKLGRTKPSKTTSGMNGSGSFGWGGEWGIKIHTASKKYQIKDINFHMKYFSVDSALFRLNIYDLKDDLPNNTILKNQIFVKGYKKDKWISKKNLEEAVVLNQDVVISYEVLRIWHSKKGSNNFFFTHGKEYQKGRAFQRKSSLGQWSKNGGFPIALYITAFELE